MMKVLIKFLILPLVKNKTIFYIYMEVCPGIKSTYKNPSTENTPKLLNAAPPSHQTSQRWNQSRFFSVSAVYVWLRLSLSWILLFDSTTPLPLATALYFSFLLVTYLLLRSTSDLISREKSTQLMTIITLLKHDEGKCYESRNSSNALFGG